MIYIRKKRFSDMGYYFFLPTNFNEIKSLRRADKRRIKMMVKMYREKSVCEHVGCENCLCHGNCIVYDQITKKRRCKNGKETSLQTDNKEFKQAKA